MGCGNKIVRPVLMPDQELSGYILSKIFATKSIYLKPSKSLVGIKVLLFYMTYVFWLALLLCLLIAHFFKIESGSSDEDFDELPSTSRRLDSEESCTSTNKSSKKQKISDSIDG